MVEVFFITRHEFLMNYFQEVPDSKIFVWDTFMVFEKTYLEDFFAGKDLFGI